MLCLFTGAWFTGAGLLVPGLLVPGLLVPGLMVPNITAKMSGIRDNVLYNQQTRFLFIGTLLGPLKYQTFTYCIIITIHILESRNVSMYKFQSVIVLWSQDNYSLINLVE